MTNLAPFKASLTLDKTAVVMMRGRWRQRIPAKDIRKWLNLYTQLRDRGGKAGAPGPWAHFYTDAVQRLDEVTKQYESEGKP